MDTVAVEGPRWDLSSEYPGPESPAVQQDLDGAAALMDRMAPLIPQLGGARQVVAAQQLHKLADEAGTLLRNLAVYAGCLLSVDSRDHAAQALRGRLQNYQKRHAELLEPLHQFCDLADDATIEAYLADPEVASSAFLVHHARRRRDQRLTLAEENLVNGLSQDGIHAWGKLYDQLSGTLSCEVLVGNERRVLGLAEASGLLQSRDDGQRRSAWQAINRAWEGHQESCAAAINAIAGWRLELCRKRSAGRPGARPPVHFLDAPAHSNRMERETLDALMDAARAHRDLARRAARLQAAAGGKQALGPWDVRAPAPALGADGPAGIAFEDAVTLIAEAYAEVDSSMGDFVRMMADRGWIEGSRGASKRPGAYCTGFPKSRTPRVYMTYTGGASDVITLAHELGHAYHGWVMRDLPESQRSYGMSLAETASTFGETLVRDAMLKQASSVDTRLEVAWQEMSALVVFVLNIPTRFEFEVELYRRRAAGPLRPEELGALMGESWRTWYGDAASEPDPLFWASKLHFYISELSFYNFPYLFGYLFSLGLYGRRGAGDGGFHARYVALLRDTGRMSAEDLAARHLDVDLREPAFWRETLASLAPRVDAFEALLEEADLAAAGQPVAPPRTSR